VRAALTKLEQPEAEQRNLLVAQALTGRGQKIYALLSSDEPRPIDDLVETAGLEFIGCSGNTTRFGNEGICAATARKTIQQNIIVGRGARGERRLQAPY